MIDKLQEQKIEIYADNDTERKGKGQKNCEDYVFVYNGIEKKRRL